MLILYWSHTYIIDFHLSLLLLFTPIYISSLRYNVLERDTWRFSTLSRDNWSRFPLKFSLSLKINRCDYVKYCANIMCSGACNSSVYIRFPLLREERGGKYLMERGAKIFFKRFFLFLILYKKIDMFFHIKELYNNWWMKDSIIRISSLLHLHQNIADESLITHSHYTLQINCFLCIHFWKKFNNNVLYNYFYDIVNYWILMNECWIIDNERSKAII